MRGKRRSSLGDEASRLAFTGEMWCSEGGHEPLINPIPIELQRQLLQVIKLDYRHQEFCAYLKTLEFPKKPLSISVEVKFKRGESSSALMLIFGVNGRKEEWLFQGWPWEQLLAGSLDAEIAEEQIRFLAEIFPVRLLYETGRLLSNPSPTALRFDTFQMSVKHGHKGDYDLRLLPIAYKTLQPVWELGKEVYKSNRAFRTWRSAVKNEMREQLKQAPLQAFVRDGFDVLDDLIERLSNTPRLSQDQIDKLNDRNLKGTAWTLALDHAAYICGVPLYYYSLRHLKTHSKVRPLSTPDLS